MPERFINKGNKKKMKSFFKENIPQKIISMQHNCY